MSLKYKIYNFIHKIPFVIKVYLAIACLAPILANDKPLVIHYENKWSFPVFSNEMYFPTKNSEEVKSQQLSEFIQWHELKTDFVLFTPIQWSPGKTDLVNANFCSPFGNQYYINENGTELHLPVARRHFFGTTRRGEDVLAGLIHGTRTSMIIGISFLIIAGFIGIILGGIAGYFGDHKLKFSFFSLLVMAILFFPAIFVGRKFYYSTGELSILSILSGIVSTAIFILIISLPLIIENKLRKNISKQFFLPVDFLISRFTELFLSLPRMILILTLAAIFRPSILMLVLIIGGTSWTDIARITRAEVMKLRDIEFIQAERAIGTSFRKIISLHLVPNIFPALQNVFVYGFASAIMAETGLSFLGIGLPAGTPSWGSLMFSARENFTAWWLVVIPGLTISLLLISLNNYGTKLLSKQIKNSQFVNIF